MNVLEAIGVTERISKGACKWHGATRVENALRALLDDAPAVVAAAEREGKNPDAAGGDASSLKSLAVRLMQHVGFHTGGCDDDAATTRGSVAFDACAAAMRLGGVPAADAPGANGTGALAGAARRLHDVASILIRVGVLDFVEPEGGGKGRGELRWLGAGAVTERLALGADGALPAEKASGYGVGAQQQAAAAAAAAAAPPRMMGPPADGGASFFNAGNNAFGAKQASTRLSNFFGRAGAAPANNGGNGKKGNGKGASVKFEDRSTLFSPPMLGGNGGVVGGFNANGAAAAAAALLKSPEWLQQLSVATAGVAPAPGGVGASANTPQLANNSGLASWTSPAFVGPLQALYAWYSGAAGTKTNGDGGENGATNARRGLGRRESGVSEDGSLGPTPMSGLSGLSGLTASLFGAGGGGSPAEVEAMMRGEAIQAAAAAAVQAAAAGVQPRGYEAAKARAGAGFGPAVDAVESALNC
jgi:hypothetical protein